MSTLSAELPVADPSPRQRRITGALIIVAVIALLLAALGITMAHRLDPAVSDGRRDAVQSAAAESVQALLTFTPDMPADRKREVAALLTGRLADRYALIGPDAVVSGVAGAGGVSTATIVGVGATAFDDDDDVRVLVFVDQTLVLPDRSANADPANIEGSTKKGTHTSIARWASMSKVDGNWRLADLTVVGGTA